MEYIYANPGWTVIFIIAVAILLETVIKAWRDK